MLRLLGRPWLFGVSGHGRRRRALPLRDEFVTDRPCGERDGSGARPGKTRTVVDAIGEMDYILVAVKAIIMPLQQGGITEFCVTRNVSSAVAGRVAHNQRR